MTALLAVIGLQADGASVREPVLVLASNHELVALLPLNSLSRRGEIADASLVLVYGTPEDPWELAREEHAVQVDCNGRKIRFTKTVKYDGRNRVTGEKTVPSDWEPVGSYPPFSRLAAAACDGERASFEEFDGFQLAIGRARESLDRK